MDLSALTKPAPPYFHTIVAPSADLGNALLALGQSGAAAVRAVRGRKATTAVDFFDEIAAALQFPHYFGENWDAAHDSLGDLAWLPDGPLVLCVMDADQLLVAAPAEQLKKCVKVLTEAAKHWNEPAKGKSAQAFHVVLHVGPGSEAAFEKRWKAAGGK